jgi:hypothetical protein
MTITTSTASHSLEAPGETGFEFAAVSPDDSREEDAKDKTLCQNPDVVIWISQTSIVQEFKEDV